jgi:tetratricopeptide (TPR) repeat protein
MFAEQLGKHDDWELRHTLQNEPRLMLLGTATQRFEQIETIQKAWFEFFTIYQLEALSLEDCRVLWTSTTGKSINDNRIRPIQVLTGGNPRLMRILIDFAVDLSLKDLMVNLSQLIDEHTDYFKSHLDNLAAAERKVFIALLEIWDPIGAREVATVSRMNVSQTSALLNRLVNRGAVTVKQGKSRKNLYQTTERLYNIYYLIRRRSHPSSRVQAAVTFMVNYYQGDELIDVTSKLANEACLLSPFERTDHFYAYKGIWDATQHFELREKLLKATPQNFLGAIDAPESIRQLSIFSTQDQFTRAEELFELGRYEEVIAILDDFIYLSKSCTELPLLEALANALFNKGVTLDAWGRFEEAITIYDELIYRFESHIELPLLETLSKTLFNKALISDSLGRSEEAIAVCDELIRRFESCAELPLLKQLVKTLFNKAVILDSLGRSEEAIAVYNELIHRFESYTELPLLEAFAVALFNKGVTLDSLGRFEEAIAVYDELIYRFERHTELPLLEVLANALFNKGDTLAHLGSSEEEIIAVYNELIHQFESYTELPLLEVFAVALFNKGVTLDSLGRSEEAITVYDEIIHHFENCTELPLLETLANALFNKGVALGSLGRSEEAITVYDEIIHHFENCTELSLLETLAKALVNKGGALVSLCRSEEAEKAVRAGLEIMPTNWRANGLLADLLVFQQKWTELWNVVPTLLTSLEKEEVESEPIISILIRIAAIGHADKVLQMLNESKIASDLEPLVVGLQLFLGEQPLVAQEILEIGQDVAQRIRETQQALQEVDIVEVTPHLA